MCHAVYTQQWFKHVLLFVHVKFSVCVCVCERSERPIFRVIILRVTHTPPYLDGELWLKLPCLECTHQGDVIEAVPLWLLPLKLLLTHTCTWLHHGSPSQNSQHTTTLTKKTHHKPIQKSFRTFIVHQLQ